MRVDVVRQPMLLVIITFLLMMCAVIARAVMAPYAVELETVSNMPLSNLIDGLFTPGLVSHIICFGLVFINAVLINSIIVRYSVSIVRTYLPIIMYTITACGFFLPLASVSAQLASLFLIMSTGEMISAFRRTYRFRQTFKSAFFLSIIPLLYAPAICLLAIIPVTLILYRRPAREVFVAISGLVLPWLLCSFAWWAAGYGWLYVSGALRVSLATPADTSILQSIVGIGPVAVVASMVYAAITAIAIVVITASLSRLRTRAKKIYIHFIWLFLIVTAIFVLPSDNITTLCLLAVPGSVISSAFFIRFHGWLSLAIYLLLVGAVLFINVLPFI